MYEKNKKKKKSSSIDRSQFSGTYDDGHVIDIEHEMAFIIVEYENIFFFFLFVAQWKFLKKRTVTGRRFIYTIRNMRNSTTGNTISFNFFRMSLEG